MYDQISNLIERRKLEAARKEISKKLIAVVKNLGKPITAQSNNYNSLPDVWMLDGVQDESYILEADAYMMEYNKGYYFDGLRYGVNLCVKSLIYEDKIMEIKATYNGYLVFSEESGTLIGYAPFPAWENPLDMFYSAAQESEKKNLIAVKEKEKESHKKEVRSLIQMLKNMWGY